MSLPCAVSVPRQSPSFPLGRRLLHLLFPHHCRTIPPTIIPHLDLTNLFPPPASPCRQLPSPEVPCWSHLTTRDVWISKLSLPPQLPCKCLTLWPHCRTPHCYLLCSLLNLSASQNPGHPSASAPKPLQPWGLLNTASSLLLEYLFVTGVYLFL